MAGVAVLLAATAAWAASPAGDLGVMATALTATDGPAAGLSLTGDALVLSQVAAGGHAALHLGHAGLGGALRFGAAWYLSRPWENEVAVAGLAGLGLRWADAPQPGLWGGARVDVPLRPALALRVEAGLQAAPGDGMHGAWISVGPVRAFLPARGEATATATASAEGRSGFDPADAMVWLPHPICQWYAVQEALDLVGHLPDDTPAEVHARGFLPAATPLGALPTLKMHRAPSQGGLVVLGAPGDRIWVAGEEVAVSGAGVALVNAVPGPVTVRLLGGGREDLLYGAVGDGYGTWLRASMPSPVRVGFTAGDARLDDAARRAVAEAAALAGGWRFAVQGSASPEGSLEDNLRLAERRAVAVLRVLLSAGLSRDQILLQSPRVADSLDGPELGRYVLITPLPRAGEPVIALLLCLLCPAALAEDLWVTRPGETVETVAAALGDPTLSAQIRALNGLGPTEQPAAGAQLRLPAAASLGATPAHVLYLRGEGTVALPGQSTTPLQTGQFLAQGALICVGEESFATLRLADSGGESHDDLNLLSGTCVRVDRSSASSAERRSLLSVEQGSVSVRAATQGTGKVSIRTPSGLTIGEQGGFRVTVEPSAARTEAVDHAVSVLGAGVSMPVRAGQGTRVRPGKAPEQPVDLLKAGALLDPEQGALLLRPDFAWLPSPRAVAYRVALSTDPDFSEVVRAEEVGQPAWAPDRLFLPTRVQGLWWRVEPVDRTGFVGLPSEARALLFPPGLGP